MTENNGQIRKPGTFKEGNPGRPAGVPNKITKTVKETVLSVFNELQDDPQSNLIAFAKKNPRDFYNIAAKLIPTEITGKMITAININEVLVPNAKPIGSIPDGD